MPEISRFLGIGVAMFPRGHLPVHFHAVYGDYQITVDVDLCDELYGEVLEPLKDQTLFQQFFVHPEFHTLTWPNGAADLVARRTVMGLMS